MSTASSPQPDRIGRAHRLADRPPRRGGRHERIGDALIASYLRELLQADPAAAELPIDMPAVAGPPVLDTLDDAELAG